MTSFEPWLDTSTPDLDTIPTLSRHPDTPTLQGSTPDAEVTTVEVDNMTANGQFARWGEAHTPPLGEHAGTHLPLRRLGPNN